MTAQANLSLNSIVYVPSGVSGGIANWINRADGTPGAFSPVSESVRSPVNNGTVYKTTFKIAVPIVATDDTTCTCAGTVLRTGTAEITLLLPNTSTTAERTDLYLRLKDLVASAPFIDAVENLNMPTG